MSAGTAVARLNAEVQTRLTGRAGPTLVAGAVLVIAGSLLPWVTFRGYPGNLKSPFFFGDSGVRIYTLLLCLAFLLALTRLPGRRKAGLAASLGIVAIALGTFLSVLNERGGLGAFALGIVLTGVGGVVAVLGFLALPADDEPGRWRRRPQWVELLIVSGVQLALLLVVVYALDVGTDDGDRSSRILGFFMFLIAACAALNALGIFAGISTLYRRHRAVTIAAGALAAAAFPFLISEVQDGSAYWIRVAASIGVFAAAAIGLNIVVGQAGLLDLGYVAFFGVGAYVAALLGNANLTTSSIELPFYVVIVLSAVIAAVFGLVIGAPTLRLRGDYLAIVTLGFGEIFRLVAQNYDALTRGPNGISGVPNLKVGSFDFGDGHTVLGVDLPYFANYYFIELLLIAFVILVFTRLATSRIGRAWVAIREDETAAEAMGVNTISMKLLAFAIGAFLAGGAGAINAHVATQVSPDSYTFLESVTLLAAVVLGGMGTVAGAILGSAVLIALPEKLRTFQDKRLLFYGVALILMMRFRPTGIVPNSRRKLEFEDADPTTGDAMTQEPPPSPGKAVMAQ
ncbi:MAG TPA: branched-chain amino acid ABC transporter permease [Mycobacteriales bacterium]|nr:branched-chain amino acid ABC transporter permease [Mycobacteriales bacterium]